jgi:hypothetical protein
MSDHYSKVAQTLRGDVAAAVRRAQRRHVMRLAARYAAVVLVTVGLVAAGALARRYIQSLTGPWRLLLIVLIWLTIASGLVLIASLRRPPVRDRGPTRLNGWRAVVRLAMAPAPRWVAVLAVAAVLVAAGALAYENWLAAAEGLVSSPQLATVSVGAGALLAAALAQAARRRWRSSRDEAFDALAAPAEDVRTRVYAGPAEVATERVRDGTRTFAVRLETHHDPGTQTLQEVAG